MLPSQKACLRSPGKRGRTWKRKKEVDLGGIGPQQAAVLRALVGVPFPSSGQLLPRQPRSSIHTTGESLVEQIGLHDSSNRPPFGSGEQRDSSFIRLTHLTAPTHVVYPPSDFLTTSRAFRQSGCCVLIETTVSTAAARTTTTTIKEGRLDGRGFWKKKKLVEALAPRISTITETRRAATWQQLEESIFVDPHAAGELSGEGGRRRHGSTPVPDE